MDSKFKANGVLANAVDYFCLVCESRLYSEIDAVSHIGKPVHTKNFELTNYFESRDDYVRKIKKWYFCELCNLLLSTATKVRLHVTEEKHIEYKSQRLLQRNGKFVVAFLNVQIHDKAWNGIIDETCVICNTEFEDEKIHVNETMHIIKLIQSKTEFDANKNVYRKTDDSSIQCLTCNMVFALSSLDAHFNLPEHIKLYQEAINSIEDATLQNDKKEINAKDGKINNKQNKEPEKEVKSPLTETNITQKDVHGESHKKNAKAIKKSDKEICDILNAKDYITKHKAQEPWCILCQWELEPSAVKSHPSDVHHQTLLKLHKKRLSKLNANQDTSLEENNNMGQAYSTNIQNYEEGVGILDSIENFYQSGIQINCEGQTAFCVKCSSSLNFNKDFIEKHIKEHTKNLEVDDLIKKDDSKNKQNTEKDKTILDCIENFQKNNIQINFEIQTAFCKKCSTSLEFKKNCIENHIEEHSKALKINDKIGQANTTIKQNDQGSSIKDCIDDFQKHDIVINFELQTANCKKCSISLDFNKAFIDNHIKGHTNTKTSEKKKTAVVQVPSKIENRKAKNTTNKKSSVFTTSTAKKTIQAKQSASYTEEDIKKFAEENDMTYMPKSKEVFCKKCNTKVPPFSTNLNQHIEGNGHKINVGKPVPTTDINKSIPKETINKLNYKKITIDSFVTSVVIVEGLLTKDIVINNRICINILSFSIVRKASDMLICDICNTCENNDQLEKHLSSNKHLQVVSDSPVVDGDEFIREVQSIGFHCAYCNIFQPSWEDMQTHLQTLLHKDCKTSGQWRLQQYMPHIQKHFFENREYFELRLLFNENNED